MATSSPGQSIHLKSPRSPRQLPALPRLHQQQVSIGEQRSPTHSQSVTKSPGTPLVFEFPPEYYPETPNTNFDFDEFGRAGEHEQQRAPSCYTRATGPPRSPKTPNSEILHSPGRKSPIFQFCEPRKQNLKQTTNYPINDRSRTANSSSSSYGPKPFDRRRSSCFSQSSLKSPMSPTIVTSTSHDAISPTSDQSAELDQKTAGRESGIYKSNGSSKTASLEGPPGMQEKIVEATGERQRNVKMSGYLNKSQGCLDEAGRGSKGSNANSRHGRGEKNMSRRSTSDLTDMNDAETEITLLSSPRRRGSMKGGLGESLHFLFSIYHTTYRIYNVSVIQFSNF